MLGFLRKNYTVLTAEPHEYSAIASLHGENFPRGWSMNEIQKLAQKSNVHMLVAHQVGGRRKQIAGFNIVQYAADEAEILSIAVASRHRRAGVGDALMRAAIRQLQADRIESLVLEVDGTNVPAVHLYDKLGFEAVGSRPGYYRSQSADGQQETATALIMRLALS